MVRTLSAPAFERLYLVADPSPPITTGQSFQNPQVRRRQAYDEAFRPSSEGERREGCEEG